MINKNVVETNIKKEDIKSYIEDGEADMYLATIEAHEERFV